ncbi:MAG: hypothetical protein MK209_01950, partial [Planctomycetes bacterium]|nr:hypothetical protein [Planctomycetota bacterium]
MRLLTLLTLLTLTGCRPDASSYESSTSGSEFQGLQNNGSQGSSAPGNNAAFDIAPDVRAPFEMAIAMRAEFEIYDEGFLVQALREDLIADGAGQFALSLDSISDGGSVWVVPSSAQLVQHEQRQHYLTLYRGLVVRDAWLAGQNYTWRQVSGNFSGAGIPAVRYHLDSKYEIGDITIEVDPQTNLLLSWVIEDPKGRPVLAQRATQVEFNPDMQGVTWATINVDTDPYDGSGSNGALGFDPMELTSNGAGFLNREEKLLHSSNFFAGRGNMHLILMGDGVRTVALAQEYYGPQQRVGNKPVKAISLRESADAGVTIIEGQIDT